MKTSKKLPLGFRINCFISGLIWFLIIAGIVIAPMVPVKAQTSPQNTFMVCDDMQTMSERIRDKYGETIQMILPNLMSPNVNGQTILTANTETGIGHLW